MGAGLGLTQEQLLGTAASVKHPFTFTNRKAACTTSTGLAQN